MSKEIARYLLPPKEVSKVQETGYPSAAVEIHQQIYLSKPCINISRGFLHQVKSESVIICSHENQLSSVHKLASPLHPGPFSKYQLLDSHAQRLSVSIPSWSRNDLSIGNPCASRASCRLFSHLVASLLSVLISSLVVAYQVADSTTMNFPSI